MLMNLRSRTRQTSYRCRSSQKLILLQVLLPLRHTSNQNHLVTRYVSNGEQRVCVSDYSAVSANLRIHHTWQRSAPSIQSEQPAAERDATLLVLKVEVTSILQSTAHSTLILLRHLALHQAQLRHQDRHPAQLHPYRHHQLLHNTIQRPPRVPYVSQQ